MIEDVVTFIISKTCSVCKMANPAGNPDKKDNDTCFFCGEKIIIPISIKMGLDQPGNYNSTFNTGIKLKPEIEIRNEVRL
jgi:hypothetical protein